MPGQRKKIYLSIHQHGAGIRRTVSTSAFFCADDVHAFRTHVKKLRAFLHWLGKDKKELPSSFKEIYHISGQLRDIQVILKSLDETNNGSADRSGNLGAAGISGVTGFVAWLKENAGRLQQLWDDSFHPGIIRKLERRLQRSGLKKPTAGRMRSFFNNGVEKIEAVVYLPAPDDEELHEMRKKLKEMYYVCDWGKDQDYARPEDTTVELLKKLGEESGQFNDKRVALLLLDAYIQQEKDEANRQAAVALRHCWEEDRLSSKAQLLQSLRDFVATY
jgi:CHAD domain-containing protein